MNNLLRDVPVMDTSNGISGEMTRESNAIVFLTVSNGDKFVVVREGVRDSFAVYTMSAWNYRWTFGGIKRSWFGYVPRCVPSERPAAWQAAALWFLYAYPNCSSLDG